MTATRIVVPTDWRGDVICTGMRVTVCAGDVWGFPHGLVVDVNKHRVQVLLDEETSPRWYQGKQTVIDEDEAK